MIKFSLHITLIGAGNVAWHLGRILANRHVVDAVFSRNHGNAQLLGSRIGCFSTDSLSELPTDSDIYMIAVSDDAVEAVGKQLAWVKGLVVHTSGSVPMDVLSSLPRYGVFYPFQTFSKQNEIEFEQIPILVEASHHFDLEILKHLAASLSQRVGEVSSLQRQKLHVAAVFASNFSNYLYGIADQMMQQTGLPFELLHPLMVETTRKACAMHPHQGQTGPAVRGDTAVILRHLELLKGREHWHDIYKLLSEGIAEQHGIELMKK